SAYSEALLLDRLERIGGGRGQGGLARFERPTDGSVVAQMVAGIFGGGARKLLRRGLTGRLQSSPEGGAKTAARRRCGWLAKARPSSSWIATVIRPKRSRLKSPAAAARPGPFKQMSPNAIRSKRWPTPYLNDTGELTSSATSRASGPQRLCSKPVMKTGTKR